MLEKASSDQGQFIIAKIDEPIKKSSRLNEFATKSLTVNDINLVFEYIKGFLFALGLSVEDLLALNGVSDKGISQEAMRIACLYDQLQDVGKELLKQTAVFAEKNFKES